MWVKLEAHDIVMRTDDAAQIGLVSRFIEYVGKLHVESWEFGIVDFPCPLFAKKFLPRSMLTE